MADLKIPEGEIAALLSKAILDSLSEETKEKLITDAISYLFTKKESSRYEYGAGKTPLQTAFHEAMGGVARDIATEVLNRPDIKNKLVNEYLNLIDAIPSFADDWDLQVAFMRAIIARAQEIKKSEPF